MKIQKVKKESLNQLQELCYQLIPVQGDQAKFAAVFEKISADDNYYFLGAYNENEQLLGIVMGVICQCTLFAADPLMIIENMIVDHQYRGQGIGTALLNRLEEIAKEHHCTFISFVSGNNRPQAHVFYDKLGFGSEQVRGFRKVLTYDQ